MRDDNIVDLGKGYRMNDTKQYHKKRKIFTPPYYNDDMDIFEDDEDLKSETIFDVLEETNHTHIYIWKGIYPEIDIGNRNMILVYNRFYFINDQITGKEKIEDINQINFYAYTCIRVASKFEIEKYRKKYWSLVGYAFIEDDLSRNGFIKNMKKFACVTDTHYAKFEENSDDVMEILSDKYKFHRFENVDWFVWIV